MKGQPQNEPRQQQRKHLILYILDVPYFLVYVVLYKFVASIFYLPLFVVLNLIQVNSDLSQYLSDSADFYFQSVLFYKGDKCSLTSQMTLAVPKLVLALAQAVLYFGYSATPIWAIEHFGVLRQWGLGSTEKGEWSTWIWVNYVIVYILMMFLQFTATRRFSKNLKFGMALRNQEQQRWIFVKSILWILAFIFSVLSCLSYFGYKRLTKDYREHVQANPQDKIKCKLYFTHAFNSCLMGGLDLMIKIAEITVYGVVLMCLGVMKVCPWRKQCLADRLKGVPDNEENKFVRAGFVVVEGVQTLIDIPIMIMVIPTFIIAPYRIKVTLNKFKTLSADKWRMMIIKTYVGMLIDLPFILMLIVLCLSVFMAIKLKRQLDKKTKDGKIKLEDIIRQEIWHHFMKLVLVYIIGLTIFIAMITVYVVSSVCIVPWRLPQNYKKVKILLQKIKLKYKDPENVLELLRMIVRNFEDLVMDYAIIISFLLFFATSLLSNWRLYYQIWWFKSEIPFFKERLFLNNNQSRVISKFLHRSVLNVKDTSVDIVTLLSVTFNIIGFWRLGLLKARRDKGVLTRGDIILNPVLTLCDLPWLIMMIVAVVITPWRFFTTFSQLVKYHAHFPKLQMQVIRFDIIGFTLIQGLIDYLFLPFYIVALLNPWHWRPFFSNLLLFSPHPDFRTFDAVTQHEKSRRSMILFLAGKSLFDLLTYFILFPLNMLSLYYLPLFVHLNSKINTINKSERNDANLKQQIACQKTFKELEEFQMVEFARDYYLPQGSRLAIQTVNELYLLQLPLFPLMVLTFPCNPYRSYQFFKLSGHTFIKGFNFKSMQELEEQETSKRADVVYCFKESLTDFLTAVSALLIIITGFRAIYLITILSVNGHVTRYNDFLQRITDGNPRLWIKLQQIKTVLGDPEKRKLMKDRYLSLKQCVWLAFVEWLLDLQILPFILLYAILLPWRLNELFDLAKTQYENVPAAKKNVQKLKHVARDLKRGGEMPKRVRVLYDLGRFIVKDYATIGVTCVLLVTGWRTLNTLEILYQYGQRYAWFRKMTKVSVLKGGVQQDILDYQLGDMSLQKKLAKEFKYLIRDALILILALFTYLLLVRSNELIRRLKGVYQKRKERKEVQALNYLNKIKLITSAQQQVEQPKKKELQDPTKVKRIVNLNKNIMSILLPYLQHDEILKTEQVSKQMAVFANFWPVWKNIYQDQHKKNAKVPLYELEMTEEEQANHDYRNACKRCFIYLKKKESEEDEFYEEDLADYYKGEAMIIMEEFLLSLLNLPKLYLKLFSTFELVTSKVWTKIEQMDVSLTQNRLYQGLSSPMPEKMSIFSVLLLISPSPMQLTIDRYDQELGDALQHAEVKSSNCIVKSYTIIANIVKRLIASAYIWVLKKISAGPVGNLANGQPPLANRQSKYANFFYFLQFILLVPMLLLFWHPTILALCMPILRLYNYFYLELDPHPNGTSDLLYLLLGALAFDFQCSYISMLNDLDRMFPYINPFEFPKLFWRQFKRFIAYIKEQIAKMVKPLFAAGKGLAHYLKQAGEFVSKRLGLVLNKVSGVITQIAYLIYNSTKGALLTMWKSVVFAFDIIIKQTVLFIFHFYFTPFEFLLKFLKNLGILGELIFTIFGLIYLLWPIGLAYFIGRKEFWVGSIILTVVLIVMGRKIIARN